MTNWYATDGGAPQAPRFKWEDFGWNQILIEHKIKKERKPNPWANINPISTQEFFRAHARVHTRAQFRADAYTFVTSADFEALNTTVSTAMLDVDVGTGDGPIILRPPSCCTTQWIMDYIDIQHPPNGKHWHVHLYWDAYSAWMLWDYMIDALAD